MHYCVVTLGAFDNDAVSDYVEYHMYTIISVIWAVLVQC